MLVKAKFMNKLTTTTSISKNTKIILLGILMLTVLAYSSAVQNGFVSNYDDNIYILQNELVKDFSWQGIKNMFNPFQDFTMKVTGHYHPITLLTWAIEYHFFGLNATPWHINNIILHLLNILLVFYLIFLLVESEIAGLIAAALFAVHPLNVESVAWITERKNVLYTLFYLAAIIRYVQYAKTKITHPENKSLIQKYFITSIVFFLFDLLCKNQAIIFPAMMILVDYYYDGKFTVKSILRSVPFFAISLAFGLIGLVGHYQGGMINQVPIYSAIDRIFMASYALVFYLVKMFFPVNLSAVYYYPDKVNGLLPVAYYLSFFVIAALGVFILKSKKFRREFIFGSLFFLANIFLVMQLIPICTTIAADRYVYVPYIGLFFIIGKIYHHHIEEKKVNEQYWKVFLIFFTIIILWFAIAVHQRSRVWKDGEVLFTDIINKYPKQSLGYYGRGTVKEARGDYSGAIQDYNNAIRNNATYIEAYYNRGNLKRKYLRDSQGAINDYTNAIRLRPAFDAAYYNRGITKYELNDLEGAIADYTKAIAYNPKMVMAYNSRGFVRFQAGQYQEAMNDYSAALAIHPQSAEVYYNRGILREQLNDIENAFSDYSKAIRFNPDYAEAYLNLGNLKQFSMNDLQGALHDYSEALRIKPDYGAAYNNRGLVKIRMNNPDGCNDLQKAVQAGYSQANELIQKFCR